MSTPLILNEEKLNIADLPGQPSVGCYVLETELHESEAGLSVTSVTGGDAVSDSNSQLPSQHLAFINTNILSEANSPRARESIERIEMACQCSPEVIDCELTALQAASQSDGAGCILGMDSRCFKNEQMTLVRTCRRISVILSWNDSEVGGRSAGRTDPKEEEPPDVVTSMRGSRGESAQVERSLEEGVKEITAVSETSGRKQDSDERWVVPQWDSGEAQRVESVGNVGTESGKQDDEAIERGDIVGTIGSGGHREDHDWENIRDIVGGYEDAEDVEKEREEKDIFIRFSRWKTCP